MAPTYRGFPPGYAGRPAPIGHPLPYPGVAPNRYPPAPRPILVVQPPVHIRVAKAIRRLFSWRP